MESLWYAHGDRRVNNDGNVTRACVHVGSVRIVPHSENDRQSGRNSEKVRAGSEALSPVLPVSTLRPLGKSRIICVQRPSFKAGAIRSRDSPRVERDPQAATSSVQSYSRLLLLLQNGRAERRVRSEWTAALHGLRKLAGLLEILPRIGIIDTVVKAARRERVPRVDAERTSIGAARCVHFGFAARVADDCPLVGLGTIAEGDRQDADWHHGSPRRGIV